MTDASKPSRWMFLLPAGLGALALGLGLMLGAIGGILDRRAAAMQSWPSTAGTVTATGVTQVRDSDDVWRDRVSTSFRYTVNGRSHALTVSEGGSRTRYTPQQSVTVYYDPANPDDAALTRASSTPSGLFAVLRAVLALVSAPFWWMAVRWFRRARAAA